jgi:hypothetical protein
MASNEGIFALPSLLGHLEQRFKRAGRQILAGLLPPSPSTPPQAVAGSMTTFTHMAASRDGFRFAIGIDFGET